MAGKICTQKLPCTGKNTRMRRPQVKPLSPMTWVLLLPIRAMRCGARVRVRTLIITLFGRSAKPLPSEPNPSTSWR
jgi:hypothetical protein